MKKIVFISTTLSEGDSLRSIAKHLAFLLARLAVRLNGTPQSILKVFIVNRLTSRCAQEKRANAKQGQAFQQISEEANVIHQRLSTQYIPRCYQSRTYT
ncbi:hypothetical protein AWE47_06590 [Piscirickettsia salmonis]|uniref:hypothetical protein n=1 Tax=Piscirickettsia salmonis TaxID=1238 RepID=UPI000742E52D|nr:hypothetical protein [Piscirickettsia salmonis]ALY02556.1 hypothetical protein AWE47_06590 [Piscirickettsia salmonis]